jgi:cytochrome o ubiquinol oxidase subunit III
MSNAHALGHEHGHDAHHDAHHDEHHVDPNGLKVMGFWIYLMSDLFIFGSLFAAFAVLKDGTFGNITHAELASESMHNAIIETALLLTSSFTSGLAVLYLKSKKNSLVNIWLGITLLLGVAFLYLEVTEFKLLIDDGHSFTASAFLSSFFGLVGTHGLHVTVGCLWLIGLMIQVSKRTIDDTLMRKVGVFALFWHFLDIVWIFVFTFVYLGGVIS